MEPNIWTGFSGPPFPFRNYAHLHSVEVITDTAEWTLVSGTFVADSAYRYLVLGNFFEDALTDTVHLAGSTSQGAYYFIDGVCVTAGPAGCPFLVGVPEQEEGQTIYLWPNPANAWVHVQGGPGEVEVTDALGRLVYSGRTEGEVAVRVDVSRWSNGQYVLHMQGKQRIVQRFVVMH